MACWRKRPWGNGRMCAPTMRATWNSGSNSPRRRKSGSPERLGEPVSGFRSPDMCWSDWADVCQPPLSPSLFSSEKGAFADFGTVVGCSADAAFHHLGRLSRRGPLHSHVILRGSRSLARMSRAWARSCSTRRKPCGRFRASNTVPRIAIVHNAQVEKEIGDLYRRCHCIIVRPANDVEGNPDIRLGLPGWKDFSDALEAMGMSDNRIDQTRPGVGTVASRPAQAAFRRTGSSHPHLGGGRTDGPEIAAGGADRGMAQHFSRRPRGRPAPRADGRRP